MQKMFSQRTRVSMCAVSRVPTARDGLHRAPLPLFALCQNITNVGFQNNGQTGVESFSLTLGRDCPSHWCDTLLPTTPWGSWAHETPPGYANVGNTTFRRKEDIWQPHLQRPWWVRTYPLLVRPGRGDGFGVAAGRLCIQIYSKFENATFSRKYRSLKTWCMQRHPTDPGRPFGWSVDAADNQWNRSCFCSLCGPK